MAAYQVTLLHSSRTVSSVASIRRIMLLCHTAKTVQEWFDKHDKKFKVLTWPSNFPAFSDDLLDVFDKKILAIMQLTVQDLKVLLLGGRYHKITPSNRLLQY